MLEAIVAPIAFALIVLVVVGIAFVRHRSRGRTEVRKEAREEEASAKRARGELSHAEYQRRRDSG